MNKEQKLTESIEKLTKQVEQLNSLKWQFLRGIFLGVGSAAGASIIAAAIYGALMRFKELIF